MTAHPEDQPTGRLHEALDRYAAHQSQLLDTVGMLHGRSRRYATRVASHRPPSAFDDLIAAVTAAPTGPTGPTGPQIRPPRSRYMVRVARVGGPHRPTRRNYDYFGELNARIAAQRSAEDAPIAGTEPAED